MIWIGLLVVAGIAAWIGWGAFKRWRDGRAFTAALNEAAARHERETAALPDGHRPLSEKEKRDAINRVRLAGRKLR